MPTTCCGKHACHNVLRQTCVPLCAAPHIEARRVLCHFVLTCLEGPASLLPQSRCCAALWRAARRVLCRFVLSCLEALPVALRPCLAQAVLLAPLTQALGGDAHAMAMTMLRWARAEAACSTPLGLEDPGAWPGSQDGRARVLLPLLYGLGLQLGVRAWRDAFLGVLGARQDATQVGASSLTAATSSNLLHEAQSGPAGLAGCVADLAAAMARAGRAEGGAADAAVAAAAAGLPAHLLPHGVHHAFDGAHTAAPESNLQDGKLGPGALAGVQALNGCLSPAEERDQGVCAPRWLKLRVYEMMTARDDAL